MKKLSISNYSLSGFAATALTGLTSTSLLLTAAFLAAATSSQAQTLTTSGNINDPENWDPAALPALGETGTVNIDSEWPATSNAGLVAIFGDLVFGGGSTLTAAIDVVSINPSSVTFNDVTVNSGDDIFTGGGGTGNFIFNAGSVTNVDDDFEANGGGTITVNGGTHTVGLAPTGTANFGAQNNSTLNFLGGTVDAGLFRTTETGTINLGGSATLTADAISQEGTFDIATDWTGSLTIPGVDWESTLIDGATFDGNPIDATIFANNFVVSGDSLSPIGGAPTSSLELEIIQNEVDLSFEWNSTNDMQYTLVSNTDLMTPPSAWLPYDDGVITYEDILSSGTGTQTLSGVLKVGPLRFFALIEEPASTTE